LATLINDLACHVNIIPLNPTNGYQGNPPSRNYVNSFRDELERMNIPCTIRLRRGLDINAGCGQLASTNFSQL